MSPPICDKTELVKSSEIDRSYIGRIEQGTRSPTLDIDRAFVAAASAQAPVLRSEVGPSAGRRERGLGQRDPQPARPLAGAPGAALAGRLVVAGGTARPM